MKLGVLKDPHFKRIMAYPRLAQKWQKIQVEPFIEKGAGEEAYYSDDDFTKNGWTCISRDDLLKECDCIICFSPLSDADLKRVKEKALVIGMYEPYNNSEILTQLSQYPIRVISMDMIPRTTIAQSMDVLSSMASLAGYRAIISAQDHLPNVMPMMMTAAGTIPPTKVLVLGAGVAGLQAIATAKRLGAVVEAFDTRAAAKDEVKSLGGKFIEVEGAKDDTAAGGYAVEQSEEFLRKQRELVQERAMQSNIIITTAQVRGRKAPILVPEETLAKMTPGSVVVDLAASTGGNCAHTRDNEVVHYSGITIVGNSHLADEVPQIASELLGNNVYNLLNYLITDGQLNLDPENEIVSSALITKP